MIFMEYTVGSADLCALFGACERNVKTIKNIGRKYQKMEKRQRF